MWKLLLLTTCLSAINGRTLNIFSNRTPKSPNPKPWFCHQLDCPRFTVSSREKGYEIRRYPSALWTSTEVQGEDFEAMVDQGFMRLFQYISGANVKKEKVAMTAPVAVEVNPGAGPACNSTFQVSFFVPFSFQSKTHPPPAPTATEVKTVTFPAMQVAVISWNGRTHQADVAARTTQLQALLDRDGKRYDKTKYFFAGYDSPFAIGRLHSEAWYLLL